MLLLLRRGLVLCGCCSHTAVRALVAGRRLYEAPVVVRVPLREGVAPCVRLQPLGTLKSVSRPQKELGSEDRNCTVAMSIGVLPAAARLLVQACFFARCVPPGHAQTGSALHIHSSILNIKDCCPAVICSVCLNAVSGNCTLSRRQCAPWQKAQSRTSAHKRDLQAPVQACALAGGKQAWVVSADSRGKHVQAVELCPPAMFPQVLFQLLPNLIL